MKLVVFGLDGVVLDVKSNESSFDILLERVGKGEKARELQKEYLKGKKSGPLLLRDKAFLFKDVKEEELKSIVREYVGANLMNGFKDVVKILKSRDYLIAIFSSNPEIILDVIKENFSEIDFVFGTKLESKDGVLTGNIIPLKFREGLEEEFKREFKDVPFSNEPNRYGLFIKLYELIKEKNIDVNKSYVVVNKITKSVMLKLIKNGVCFNPVDVEMEEKAAIVINEKDLRKILDFNH